MRAVKCGLLAAALVVGLVLAGSVQGASRRTCLKAVMQHHGPVDITVDGYPGRTWTWRYGDEPALFTLHDFPEGYNHYVHSVDADGGFNLHITGPHHTTWYFDSTITQDGYCDGAWVATITD